MRLVDGINREVSWPTTDLFHARDAVGNDVLLLLGDLCDAAPPNETACSTKGELLAWGGATVEPRPTEALAILDASCGRGQIASCVDVGWLYLNGIGVVSSATTALAYLEPYCTTEHLEGCVTLASVYEKLGRVQDAVTVTSAACDLGVALACTATGLYYYFGNGANWDMPKAAEYNQRGCDGGDTQGCANLAEGYEYGVGVDLDLEKSRALYEDACAKKQTYACSKLGYFYERGLGGATRDEAHAIELYRIACTERDSEPLGCGRLSMALRRAHQDTEAAEMAQRAYSGAKKFVDGKSYYYTWVLGVLYRDGIGVSRDLAQAGKLMVEACENNEAIGCLGAAEFYLGADGGTIDYDIAQSQAERACVAKVARGCELSGMAHKRVPLAGGKAHTCGCHSGGETGVYTALVTLALLARRRRRVNVA
jgi:MYXO-CTERM domain-containing protein